MKKLKQRIIGMVAIMSVSGFLTGTLAAETNLSPQLTLELRDGSRVIGTSSQEYLHFHSKLLGNFKLPVKDIRSIEFISANSAALKTSKGDVLTVQFSGDSFPVKTSFGTVELAANSVRRVTVSGRTTFRLHVPGLAALWAGEGNADDSAGGSPGDVEGSISFVPGKVGTAFSFDDPTADIKVPATHALDVGSGRGFTLTAWVNPSTVSLRSPIFEWNQNDGSTLGVHFYIDANSGGPGTLYANIVDANGGWHYFYTYPGAVTAGTFQFVALTYDKASGMADIYCNGVLLVHQNLGSFTPLTSCDLYLGKRPPTLTNVGVETFYYAGLLDEAAVYDHALTAWEIRFICAEENSGKLPPPPEQLHHR